ncbi:ubiquitin-like protein Pup [Saccharopolyspora hirsuta]|uniref:Prokaryotic ubiquitin-like protein Pup n=1 Tax=Saccharopolyspora hirsuta TaxID=1837 RepID=A0A5M7BE18_SACHI|nr:ubiquitin-like protein Pup [Saccharopolyspora hirsuta]KAA5825475.1 ubiquitin-like protein Pup [Saccharopolyspora hirsuta]
MRQEKNRKHIDHDEDPPTPTPRGANRRHELDGAAESLLEEIDDVLEDNADEFVRSYIQKGGQ